MAAIYFTPSTRPLNRSSQTRLEGVLVVALDDSPEAIRLLQRIFDGCGARFFGFTEAESFLQFVRDSAPDLILLDIVMPGLDGFEVFARLREDSLSAQVPVTFLSSILDPRDSAAGPVEGERTAVLSKPFTRRTLLQTAVRLLKTS